MLYVHFSGDLQNIYYLRKNILGMKYFSHVYSVLDICCSVVHI